MGVENDEEVEIECAGVEGRIKELSSIIMEERGGGGVAALDGVEDVIIEDPFSIDDDDDEALAIPLPIEFYSGGIATIGW